jgi:hypothetical protein
MKDERLIRTCTERIAAMSIVEVSKYTQDLWDGWKGKEKKRLSFLCGSSYHYKYSINSLAS